MCVYLNNKITRRFDLGFRSSKIVSNEQINKNIKIFLFNHAINFKTYNF